MKKPAMETTNTLTHFDSSGQAHMVDVGDKAHTRRIAVASGIINMQPCLLYTSDAADE